MKCKNCCHAEMCKWIDELEGRGCDFYGGESISHTETWNGYHGQITAPKGTFQKIWDDCDQEPCDDAII